MKILILGKNDFLTNEALKSVDMCFRGNDNKDLALIKDHFNLYRGLSSISFLELSRLIMNSNPSEEWDLFE